MLIQTFFNFSRINHQSSAPGAGSIQPSVGMAWISFNICDGTDAREVFLSKVDANSCHLAQSESKSGASVALVFGMEESIFWSHFTAKYGQRAFPAGAWIDATFNRHEIAIQYANAEPDHRAYCRRTTTTFADGLTNCTNASTWVQGARVTKMRRKRNHFRANARPLGTRQASLSSW